MKALASLIFAPLAFAAILQEHQHFSSSMSLESSSTPGVAVTNSTGGGYCGIGYTYCGYILKEQKSKGPLSCFGHHRPLTPIPVQTLMRPPFSRPTVPVATVTRRKAPRRQIPFKLYSCAFQSPPFPRGVRATRSHTRARSRSSCSALAVARRLEVGRTYASTLVATTSVGAVRLVQTRVLLEQASQGDVWLVVIVSSR